MLEENRNRVLAFMFRTEPYLHKTLELEELEKDLAVCREHIAESGEKLIVDAFADNYQHYRAAILA